MYIVPHIEQGFKVVPGREYALQSSGHRLLIREVDRKRAMAKAYMYSTGRHIWLPIALIRTWYTVCKRAKR